MSLSQDDIQIVVEDLMNEVSLRDLVSLAHMDGFDVQILQDEFELYIGRKAS